MSDKKLTLQQKKDLAKLLYTREGMTNQKALAERVGVSQNSMSKWVNEGDWERLRKSIVFTKDEQLKELYEQLTNINADIKAGLGYPDTKQADIVSKLTAAVAKLETETNIQDAIEVGKRFIIYVQGVDCELAKSITSKFDNFLKMLINESK